MYYDLNDKTPNFLNKFLHESLFLLPIIILIVIFLQFKIFLTVRWFSPRYDTRWHSRVEKRIINHY